MPSENLLYPDSPSVGNLNVMTPWAILSFAVAITGADRDHTQGAGEPSVRNARKSRTFQYKVRGYSEGSGT